MHRKRSGVYSAGGSGSRHTYLKATHDFEAPDPRLSIAGGKCAGKDYFSDVRVEGDRERPLRPISHSAYLRGKPSTMRAMVPSKVSIRTRSPPTANVSTLHDSATLTPSKVQHALRRCHSASAVRKKLFSAVEQGNSSNYQHPNHKLQAQIDALRSLAASATTKVPTKTPTKTQYGHRGASRDTTTSSSSAIVQAIAGKPPRLATGTPVLSNKSHNQEECIAGVSIGPSRSMSLSSLSSPSPSRERPSTASATPSVAQHAATPVLVGGYRSSSIQLEVELVERLNEIGRSNLKEKTLSRTRACQQVLDRIILEDEHYGRLLSRVRDEFGIYVDITSRKSPAKPLKSKSSSSWCSCGQDVFEFALLRQENTVLKKNMTTMQREVEELRAALRQATAGSSSSFGSDSGDSSRSCRSSLSRPEDDQEDDLDDIPLFPMEKILEKPRRPLGVPPLSFASLPAYNEDEEDGSEGEDEYF